jgi:hypothetical protein
LLGVLRRAVFLWGKSSPETKSLSFVVVINPLDCYGLRCSQFVKTCVSSVQKVPIEKGTYDYTSWIAYPHIAKAKCVTGSWAKARMLILPNMTLAYGQDPHLIQHRIWSITIRLARRQCQPFAIRCYMWKFVPSCRSSTSAAPSHSRQHTVRP